jgi:pseudouridine-5'-phosphate glycosidase
MSAPPLMISDEVRAALADRRPVVALETSIVSQGMPWPQNLETALAVEAIIREGGAVPRSPMAPSISACRAACSRHSRRAQTY